MVFLKKLTLDFLFVYYRLGYNYIAIDKIDHGIFMYTDKPRLGDECWYCDSGDFYEIEHEIIYEDVCPNCKIDIAYSIEELLKHNNIIVLEK